jgi:hypothetical protein
MNANNFTDRQKEAINRMREMNSRSTTQNAPPPPDKPSPKPVNEPSIFSGFNLPFLETLKTDGDLTLILGLLLLLLSENADKRLLFALIYILL